MKAAEIREEIFKQYSPPDMNENKVWFNRVKSNLLDLIVMSMACLSFLNPESIVMANVATFVIVIFLILQFIGIGIIMCIIPLTIATTEQSEKLKNLKQKVLLNRYMVANAFSKLYNFSQKLSSIALVIVFIISGFTLSAIVFAILSVFGHLIIDRIHKSSREEFAKVLVDRLVENMTEENNNEIK